MHLTVLTLGRRLQLETRFLQSRYHVYVCRYEADHCASIICFPVWAAGGPQFPSSSVFCPADYENSRPGLLVCARLDGRGSTKCTAQNAIRSRRRFYNQCLETPTVSASTRVVVRSQCKQQTFRPDCVITAQRLKIVKPQLHGACSAACPGVCSTHRGRKRGPYTNGRPAKHRRTCIPPTLGRRNRSCRCPDALLLLRRVLGRYSTTRIVP